MLDCERYIGLAVAGSRRKMVCWGGVRPRPGPLLPPLEGGGRRPRNGPRVVLPPVRKSPVSRTCCACCRARTRAGRVAGHGGGQGVQGCMVLMHLRMLRMSVACVTARATAVLDVCVLPRHRCASVAVVMYPVRCDACRCAWFCAPSAAIVTARLLAGAARQRAASRGAQSAE
jgi:hypothetical protein